MFQAVSKPYIVRSETHEKVAILYLPSVKRRVQAVQ